MTSFSFVMLLKTTIPAGGRVVGWVVGWSGGRRSLRLRLNSAEAEALLGKNESLDTIGSVDTTNGEGRNKN